MKLIAIDSRANVYKFSLNKREKTLKVYQQDSQSRKFIKFLIATGLSKQDIREIEDMTSNDLLSWVRRDYSSYFTLWR